jgi:hypothetical protein
MLPSAPRSRVYRQVGFSVANWTTRRCSEAAVPDLPRPRRAVLSYLFAMSSRYQRRIVSGVTRPPSWSSTRRPSALPFAASGRRWALVKRRRRPPSCSRRTRFSSWRNSTISSWRRLTQPANTSSKNCSGATDTSAILPRRDPSSAGATRERRAASMILSDGFARSCAGTGRRHAGASESDPDARIIKMLGARGSHVAAEIDEKNRKTVITAA